MDDDIDGWRQDIDRSIKATLASVAAATLPAGAAGHDLTQAILRASEGGKRVRSVLLLASHHAHGGSAPRAAVALGAALELFHTAALLHDDVLDDADTRRGQPATHRHFADHHREKGWEGDAGAFGTAGAILAGDIALLASARALHAATAQLGAPTADLVATLFHDTADLVTAGQFLDMRLAAQPLDQLPGQEGDIRATMRAKTASYTAEAPLALGAASAGANEARVAALRSIGVILGLAFQMRDDILGVTGTPDVTGKPVGDDIREGKRTLLLWHGWTGATPAQRRVIRKALGVHDADDADVAAAIDAIRAVGAFDAVEAEIAAASAAASDRLAALDLEKPYGEMLRTIAANATHRSN